MREKAFIPCLLTRVEIWETRLFKMVEKPCISAVVNFCFSYFRSSEGRGHGETQCNLSLEIKVHYSYIHMVQYSRMKTRTTRTRKERPFKKRSKLLAVIVQCWYTFELAKYVPVHTRCCIWPFKNTISNSRIIATAITRPRVDLDARGRCYISSSSLQEDHNQADAVRVDQSLGIFRLVHLSDVLMLSVVL